MFVPCWTEPTQAWNKQAPGCWMKVTSQRLPLVHLYHSPLRALRQRQYLFIQASLLCPEAGEGTVKTKVRQKILSPVIPWNYCYAVTAQVLPAGRQSTCLFPYWRGTCASRAWGFLAGKNKLKKKTLLNYRGRTRVDMNTRVHIKTSAGVKIKKTVIALLFGCVHSNSQLWWVH